MQDPLLAEAFRPYLAGREEHRSPARLSEMCFGCGRAHPGGLRVRCFETDDGVVSPILIARHHEGPPGVAHGGIVAAYLDEVLAAAVARVTGRVAVTGELTVRYVSPTPTDTAILGWGRVVSDQGRYWRPKAT
jgi:acyl-coenzyme A thioesterase PaaI-like protein